MMAVFGKAFELLMETATTDGFGRFVSEGFLGGIELVPTKTAGMPLKASGRKVFEGAGAIPWTLVVAVKDFA